VIVLSDEKDMEAKEDAALLKLMEEGMASGDASRDDFDRAIASVK